MAMRPGRRRCLVSILLLLILAVCAAKPTTPAYILAEDHHHVVPHLLQFIRSGKLRSNATLLHIDSHADINLPQRLPPSLRHSSPKDAFQIVGMLEINNFVLGLAYMGIIGHVIFCEPPWARLFTPLYGEPPATIHIVSHPQTHLLHINVQHPTEQEFVMQRLDTINIVSWNKLIEIASYNITHIRTIHLTAMGYHDAPILLPEILGEDEQDLILDMDMDFVNTFSPGALALYQDLLPNFEDLMQLFHLFHLDNQMCDLDQSYWERALRLLLLKEGTTKNSTEMTKDCTHHRWTTLADEKFEDLREKDIHLSLLLLIDTLHHGERLGSLVPSESWKLRVAQFMALHGEAFEKYNKGGLSLKLAQFLVQPFHVDADTIFPIINYWKEILKQLDMKKPPTVVNLVRSPFYTPHHFLGEIECLLRNMTLELFPGDDAILHHAVEVKPDRCNCKDAFQSSPEGHIGVSYEYEFDASAHMRFFPEATDFESLFTGHEKEITLFYTNGHYNNNATVYINVEKREVVEVESGETSEITTEPGDELFIYLSRHDAEQRKVALALERIKMDPTRGGAVQAFTSRVGYAPLHNHTPVRFIAKNPSNKETLTVYVVDKNDERKKVAEVAPGEHGPVDVLHGHKVELTLGNNQRQHHVVDGTNGQLQRLTFHAARHEDL